MSRKKTNTLTNAEHRIMEVVWARGSATVADVVEAELILAVPAIPVRPGTDYVERTWGDAEDEPAAASRENPFDVLKKIKVSR